MEFKIKYIQDEIDYDGSQLSSHFAYKNFNINGDSLIGFCGKCNIPEANMADLEDVIEKEQIYSSLMLHFIGEFFFNNLYEVVLYQRIFASIIKDEITKITTRPFHRDGDDLFSKDKKLSISIACPTGTSVMFHFAMNIESNHTPVDTISLPELGIDNIHEFAWIILKKFKNEIERAEYAKCKVRLK
ncbi:MAG: DUF366 family protein [Candidatus Muirbacterium halophilum]|nr:DUF366 family protein [Candidatus Muirbacterium halophilum]MCK9476093.1 DUF366 family protein [Candidatus Muirbacterium halophilum]